jgi:hypothetical protein
MFDTGSEMLALQTSDCANEFEKFCHYNWYDVSTSYRYSKPSVAKYERTYYQSQIWLRGSMVEDIVCMKSDWECIDPFPFLGVSQQVGLPDDVIGILGLALGNEVKA